MNNFIKWLLMNLLLPLSPILLKLFILFVGPQGVQTFLKIVEMPELVFYSICTCIIALNINLNGNKKLFETLMRLFLFVVLILDFVVLGMMYLQNTGPNALHYSIIAALIPALIAPIYKYIYSSSQDGEVT